MSTNQSTLSTAKMIRNYDLLKHKYDESVLMSNIEHLNKNMILNTQVLSEEFCAKYIFCIDDIDDGDEDSYLFDLAHILNTQPHLDKQKLRDAIDKYCFCDNDVK